MPIGDSAWLFFDKLPAAICERVVTGYSQSESREEAASWAMCIHPNISSFSVDQLKTILTTSLEKPKTHVDYHLARMTFAIRKADAATKDQLEPLLIAVNKAIDELPL